MKKMMLMLLCTLVAVPALARGKTQPVYEPEIYVDGNHSKQAIGKVIKKALVARNWAVKKDEGGVIHSQIWVRSHSAKIKITYNKKEIKIHFVASENLNQKNKGETVFIHRNYNRWIKNIERDIQSGLFSL